MPYDHPTLHQWDISRTPTIDPYLLGYYDPVTEKWVLVARLYGHKGDIGSLGNHILNLHNASVRTEVEK